MIYSTCSQDRYILYPEILGQGANSLVAVAEEISNQKTCAVKVIITYKQWAFFTIRFSK